MSTLEFRLAASRERVGKILKPEIAATMERQIASLRTDGTLERALGVGAKAPMFFLSDQRGTQHDSRDLIAHGPLVLTFFRGTWCPYCATELAALAEAYPRIRALGATLVAITPQSATNAADYYAANPVPFPVLVDVDGRTARAYGLSFAFPDDLREIYTNTFSLDLARINADRRWTLPMPARYIIDGGNTIVDARVDPDYRFRPEPDETIAILQKRLRSVVA